MTDTAAGRLGRGGAAEARAGRGFERGAARLPPAAPCTTHTSRDPEHSLHCYRRGHLPLPAHTWRAGLNARVASGPCAPSTRRRRVEKTLPSPKGP